MKKLKKKISEPDDELMGPFKPRLKQRIKQRRVYDEDLEKHAGEKITRRYGQRNPRKIKLKGEQWEDWDS